MKLSETVVIWTPSYAAENFPDRVSNAGAVRIERHGSNWQRTFGDMWMPAWSAFENYPGKVTDPMHQALSLFILFNTLVVRDGINPTDAHRAFLGIDEYRQMVSPEIRKQKETAA